MSHPNGATDHTGRPVDDVVIDLRDPLEPERAGERPVSGRPADLAEGLQLVRLTERDKRWDQAEQFVYDIYQGAGYCRESPRGVVEELQAYSELSVFYAVFDEDSQVVGTSRNVFGAFSDLPVGAFERTDRTDPDPMAELSSLSVNPTARGLSVVVHLCRAVFVDATRRGASALAFAIDDWMVELLAGSYCLPVRPIGVRREYMGGDISPTAMTLSGENFEDCARRNPGYWQWMTEAFTPEEMAERSWPIVLTDHPTDLPDLTRRRIP